jgi:transcriptional regulator
MMPYRAHESHLSSVLTEEQVKELIDKRKQGWTYKKLGLYFGVHRNTIYNILKRANDDK